MSNRSSTSPASFEASLSQLLPHNSVDCVILGYENQELKVLLLQWKINAQWCLPGGFIFKDEDMDTAAHRVLQERTGLEHIFLNQFHTFGQQKRAEHPTSQEAQRIRENLPKLGFTNPHMVSWFTKRFVTTGYFALVDVAKTHPKPDFLSSTCQWKSLKHIPKLVIDHNEIVDKAIAHLRIQLNYLPLGLTLLPEKFTMQDLQRLYEAILDKPLERSNFQRKILKLGVLVRREKLMSGAAHKAPYLYSFDEERYYALLKNGIGFL